VLQDLSAAFEKKDNFGPPAAKNCVTSKNKQEIPTASRWAQANSSRRDSSTELQELNGFSPSAIQRKAYNILGLLRRADDTLTESTEESHRLLMAEHFPGSTNIPEIMDTAGTNPDPLGATGRYNHPVLVDDRPWLNLTSLDIALKQFDKLKCPGPDGFRPIVLCHLPLRARQALIDMYNAVIELHNTPLLWRGSEIIFLPKPGKDDYTDKRTFRPISLMPFLFKAMERMVKWHVAEHANAFHPDQHAFRKGHSTENALSHMADAIEEHILTGKNALAVFLDIKGAFDNLSSATIANGMRNHNVDEDIMKRYV
jgi:hypothetical protein